MSNITINKKVKTDPLKKLIISSLLLAVGLIIKQMSLTVPIMGVPGLRVDFSGVFTFIPAVIFGPFYGAITAGMGDMIGHFLNPTGPFFPHFTVMAAIGGAMRGYLWIYFRGVSLKKLKTALTIIFTMLIASGAYCSLNVYVFSDSVVANFLTGLKISSGSQMATVTYVPILVGLIGFIIMYTNEVVVKKNSSEIMNQKFLPLILTLLISGVLVTTVNTIIIMYLYGIEKAFALFYIPRLIEEIITNIVGAYIISWVIIRSKMEKYL